MELALVNWMFSKKLTGRDLKAVNRQNLTHADINLPYVIKGIDAHDEGTKDFLFTLGCFEGEKVTVITVLADNYIINLKNARYSIDKGLAKAILI
ncbi:MAG: FeoA family protein [Bacillota bacterium]|nr:FeoA family protein [Bacillota bacterium]